MAWSETLPAALGDLGMQRPELWQELLDALNERAAARGATVDFAYVADAQLHATPAQARTAVAGGDPLNQAGQYTDGSNVWAGLPCELQLAAYAVAVGTGLPRDGAPMVDGLGYVEPLTLAGAVEQENSSTAPWRRFHESYDHPGVGRVGWTNTAETLNVADPTPAEVLDGHTAATVYRTLTLDLERKGGSEGAVVVPVFVTATTDVDVVLWDQWAEFADGETTATVRMGVRPLADGVTTGSATLKLSGALQLGASVPTSLRGRYGNAAVFGDTLTLTIQTSGTETATARSDPGLTDADRLQHLWHELGWSSRGFTRKYPREIVDPVWQPGSNGQRARFLTGTSAVYYEHDGTSWSLAADQKSIPDVIETVGLFHPGDYWGPWLVEDIRDVLDQCHTLTFTQGEHANRYRAFDYCIGSGSGHYAEPTGSPPAGTGGSERATQADAAWADLDWSAIAYNEDDGTAIRLRGDARLDEVTVSDSVTYNWGEYDAAISEQATEFVLETGGHDPIDSLFATPTGDGKNINAPGGDPADFDARGTGYAEGDELGVLVSGAFDDGDVHRVGPRSIAAMLAGPPSWSRPALPTTEGGESADGFVLGTGTTATGVGWYTVAFTVGGA